MPPRPQVLWKYTDKDTNQPHMIWSTGRVVRVADGLSDKRSKRARSVLPAGAVLWAWDADPEFDEEAGEQWLFLLPKKWNPKPHKQVYSWRYDPRELGAVEAPTACRRMCRRDARSSENFECVCRDAVSVLDHVRLLVIYHCDPQHLYSQRQCSFVPEATF